tara:strand:+ start:17379 stop:18908 length:1530 start_codon:yes stop_codon:yes gene_type:complete
MTKYNYSENIKALRAGTALETPAFIESMRSRYKEELGKDVICVFLDPALFEEHGFVKDGTITHSRDDEEILGQMHATSNVRILQRDIADQYKDATGDSFDLINHKGKPTAFQKMLTKLERTMRIDDMLDDLEDNKAMAYPLSYNGKTFTAITPLMTDNTYIDELCEATGWQKEDVKYTGQENACISLEANDHEMGHAILNTHLEGQFPIAPYYLESEEPEEYNAYIHECMADTFSQMCALHDGAGLENIDVLSLTRAYNGVRANDAVHFTCATLQHLKEHIDIEYIRGMENKSELADYCLKFVLGDKETGLEPAFLSEQAYEKQKQSIEGVYNKTKHFCEGNQAPTPTPLQYKMVISEMPETFTEAEQDLLQRHVIVHSRTMVHKNDVAHELTALERFNNPQIIEEGAVSILALKETESELEKELQNKVYPVDEEGYLLNIPLEERNHALNTIKRALLAEGHLTEDDLALINEYQNDINMQMDKEEELNSFIPQDRSRNFVTHGREEER